jgi:hypothetical protein
VQISEWVADAPLYQGFSGQRNFPLIGPCQTRYLFGWFCRAGSTAVYCIVLTTSFGDSFQELLPRTVEMDTSEFRRSCAPRSESPKLKRKKLVILPPDPLEDPFQKAACS